MNMPTWKKILLASALCCGFAHAAHAGEQKYSCLAAGMDKPVEVRIVNDEVLIYDGSPIPITPPINATKSTSGWRMLNGRADLGAWDYNTKRLIFNGSPSFVLNCVS